MNGLEPGGVIAGRYELLSFQASYEGYSIFSAMDVFSKKIVSLKLASFDALADPVVGQIYMERMKRDARVLSYLRHPNLVKVEDYFLTETGDSVLVMEELEGKSLAQLVAENRGLNFEAAFPVIVGVCEGLEAAHKRQIFHTDLKPAGVFLAFNRTMHDFVKIIDFGSAVFKEQDPTGTQCEFSSLSESAEQLPCYRSPEQVAGQKIDQRSDLFGLSCLFFEILSGHPAFCGKDIKEAAHGKPLPVPDLKRRRAELALPEGVEDLILRNLQKQTAFRQASMLEFKERLLQLVGIDSVMRLEAYLEKARSILYCL